jgi:hypothetical protein
MPRCQALSADWLYPIKWHDIIFAGSLWLSPSFWLCFLDSCKIEPVAWRAMMRAELVQMLASYANDDAQ